MEKIINRIKSLPFGVKISQIIYIIVILIYMYISSGKGLTTTFFSFMGVVVTAAIASIYLMFFQKNYILAIIDLFVAAVIFIQLASMS